MRTAKTILMAGIIALASLVSTGASADDYYLIREADRLYAASIRFTSEVRHHHHARSYRDKADKFSREAARFRRAVHERHDRRRLEARYNELVKYFYRLEREFRHPDYRSRYERDRGYLSLEFVFRDLDLAFGSVNRGYRSYPQGRYDSWDRRDYYTHDNRYFGRDQRYERKHRSKDRRYDPPRKQRHERESRRNHYRD